MQRHVFHRTKLGIAQSEDLFFITQWRQPSNQQPLLLSYKVGGSPNQPPLFSHCRVNHIPALPCCLNKDIR